MINCIKIANSFVASCKLCKLQKNEEFLHGDKLFQKGVLFFSFYMYQEIMQCLFLEGSDQI